MATAGVIHGIMIHGILHGIAGTDHIGVPAGVGVMEDGIHLGIRHIGGHLTAGVTMVAGVVTMAVMVAIMAAGVVMAVIMVIDITAVVGRTIKINMGDQRWLPVRERALQAVIVHQLRHQTEVHQLQRQAEVQLRHQTEVHQLRALLRPTEVLLQAITAAHH